MPSLNDMLKDMTTHKNFYLRGVINSLLPEFMNPLDKNITENNISGEAIELLRGIAESLAPDMKDGEVMQMEQYTGNVDKLLYLDDKMLEETGTEGLKQTLSENSNFENSMLANDLRNSLGNFGLTKVNGEYVVFDTYDFDPYYRQKTVGDDSVFQAMHDLIFLQDPQPIAQEIGQVLMPENADDSMKVRIRIPNEQQLIDIDFDNDIEPDAETFVFEGPMTNKRKTLWDSFTSMLVTPAEAQTNDNVDPKLKRDLSTMRVLQVKGKDPFPMDGNDEYGRMNDAQRAIADESSDY